MLDPTSLLRVTEGLYGAALGLGRWDDALDRVAELAGADHLILHAAGPAPFVASARLDERDLQRALGLWATYGGDGPGIEGLSAGRVVNRASLMPDEAYERTAQFNEVIRPLGGYHAMGALGSGAASGSSLQVCRGVRQVAFDEHDASLVGDLMPHISFAIGLSALVVERRSSWTGQGLLEALAEAAVICDSTGRMLGGNRAAMTLFDAAEGLEVSRSRVAATHPTETTRLRDAIFTVATTAEQRRLRLRRPSGRAALSLRLVPVGQLGPAFGDPHTVAIFITEPDAALPIDRAAVADAFGLAPREAELACLLATGMTPPAMASAAGLTVGSVRTYLKRIYRKTGAHSQTALVSLLRGFV
jgi:DNA-binding CsgD family transcriptional regulator/PAS domain-containing protein